MQLASSKQQYKKRITSNLTSNNNCLYNEFETAPKRPNAKLRGIVALTTAE